MRGELAEQLRPSVLALLRHVSWVVAVVLVGVRVAVSTLHTHHASAAMHLHLGQLSGNDGAPLADNGRALLLIVLRRCGSVVRCNLLNLANQELVLGEFDQVNTNVGKTIDENRADFDDLQFDDDHIHTLVSHLCCRLNLETESKLLFNSLWSAIMGSELVVALKVCSIVVLVVLLVVFGLVGDLRGDKDVGEWIRIGVQFETVHQQTVRLGGGVNGEIELEMAAVWLVMFRLAVVLFEDWWAAWAIQADTLRLSSMDTLEGNRLDDLDFMGANVWR